MTSTLQLPRFKAPPRRHPFSREPEASASEDDALASGSRLNARFARLGALLLLATGLIFCHGCHGDEDNELSIFFPRLQNEKRERGEPRPLPSQHSSTQRASGRGTSIGAG
jgi:hypothetical protein